MLVPDLDRMNVEDVGWTPESRAAAIHRQLGDITAPIPVREVAHALDIIEIRERPLQSYEGCLVTDAERNDGDILINSRSSPFRQRYTIAHELGHFLCGWHKPSEEGGFRCSRRDMIVTAGEGLHRRQEAEANRFAIELLAPERLLKKYLKRLPELETVLTISIELEISKAAAARRYVELHSYALAVIFCLEGRFLYSCRGGNFPWLPFRQNDPLPELPLPTGSPLSEMVQVDPRDWLATGAPCELAVQVLRQQNGHAVILLHADGQ